MKATLNVAWVCWWSALLAACNLVQEANFSERGEQESVSSSNPIEAPALSYPTPLTASIGDSVTLIPAIFGDATGFTSNPALPSGLSLSPVTGIISGVPAVITPTTAFSIEAASSSGPISTTLFITINDIAPSTLSYSTPVGSYTLGVAISNNLPSAGGGAVTSYSISAALPAGLSFNTTTGIISGTPTVTSASSNYVVSATNSGGTTTTTLTIGVGYPTPTVSSVLPGQGSTAGSTSITLTGTQFYAGVTVSVGGAACTSVTVVSATTLTCTTPAGAAGSQNVIVSNPGPIASTPFSGFTYIAPPTNLSYTSSVTLAATDTMTALNPSSLGGAITSYSVNPALPNGISLNPTTGVISGTPTAPSAKVSYSVSGTNGSGATVSASVFIEVLAKNNLKIEVPIELVDVGLASGLSPITFNRTRTSFDPTAYNGTTLSLQFEISAINTDSAVRAVRLIKADNFQETGALINVPAGITVATRFRVSIAPSSITDYRVKLDGTTVDGELQVFAARLIVTQVNPTKTRLFIPLTAGAANFFSSTDAVPSAAGNCESAATLACIDRTALTNATGVQITPKNYSIWRKTEADFSTIAASAPWTFEAVMNTSSASSGAEIFLQDTSGNVVSTLSTSNTTPTLLSTVLLNNATNFTNTSSFWVKIRSATGAGIATLYRSNLWLNLTLDNAGFGEVSYRLARSVDKSDATTDDLSHLRMLLTTSNYSNPSFFLESIGFTKATVVTSATPTLTTCGTNDSGANCTSSTGHTLPFTSSSPTRLRSASLLSGLTSGDRYGLVISNSNAAGFTHNASYLVIKFQN